MKFLIDKEINLEKQDLLNTNSYANTIKDAILNSPDNDSFCIGLFGEWGSGKSSIIKTVKENLEGSKDKKIRFVTYDAWKYANDSFRRMFLRKMKEDLKLKSNSDFDSFYQNKSVDKKIIQKPNWNYIIFTILIFFIGVGVISLNPSQDTKTLTTLLLSFIAILVNVIGRGFADLKVSVSEPMTFAPEQFEECFIEMANLALSRDTIFTKPLKWIENVLTGNQNGLGLDKIVIVIDNIDRTQKELAYELLTNTKNFLGKIPNVIFLIPIDDGALKKHIANINSEPKEAEEFLRKFFNLTFRIKSFRPIQMYDFTKKLFKDFGLSYSNYTIDIISQEYATNPRRIIQFTNNLTVELNYLEKKFGTGFITENESIICIVLILKEEWPIYYKLIANNTYLLQNSDTSINEILKSDTDLSNFLKKMKAVINDSNSDALNKIVSNSESVGTLNDNILENINDGNVENVVALCNLDDIDNADLENYLVDKLQKGINNKLYQTEVRNVFGLIIGIDNLRQFSKAFNSRILNLLINTDVHNFIEFVETPELIIKYTLNCKKQGLVFLTDLVNNYMRTAFVNKEIDYKEFDRLLLKNSLELSDNENAKNLKDEFSNEYIYSKNELASYEFSDEKLKILISNEIVTHLITKLIEEDFEEEFHFNELLFVTTKINLSSEQFSYFYQLLNIEFSKYSGKGKVEVFKFLNSLNRLLGKQFKNISKISDEAYVKEFYTNVTSSKVGTSYTSKSVINQIDSDEEAKIFLEFLLNIRKSSLTPISINKELAELFTLSEDYRNIFEKIIFDLHKSYKINFSEFSDFILKSDNYNEITFYLLENLFVLKASLNKYFLDDKLVKSKIEKIFKQISSSDLDKIKFFEFLEKLKNDERCRNLLVDIISDLDKDDILDLSPQLQQLTFDKIATEENLFKYEDNLELLKAIAEIGEKKHVQVLFKVIIVKLQKSESIGTGLEILSSIKELHSKGNKVMLNILDGLLEKDEYNERVKILLKKFKK